MLGSAVMTTVASRMIIRYVARITPRIRVGFGRAAASGADSAWRARPVRGVRSKTGLSRLEELHFEPEVASTCFGGCLRFLSRNYSGGPLRFVKSPKMTLQTD